MGHELLTSLQSQDLMLLSWVSSNHKVIQMLKIILLQNLLHYYHQHDGKMVYVHYLLVVIHILFYLLYDVLSFEPFHHLIVLPILRIDIHNNYLILAIIKYVSTYELGNSLDPLKYWDVYSLLIIS